jgi:hypothetical protein
VVAIPPRLFALDHCFPEPIVDVLRDWLTEAELVSIRHIDSRLTEDTEDWQLLLALHHHERPWDGLITNDSSMLWLAREVSVLMQTRLTLVVADGAGHDPLKATGLVFAHLPWICPRVDTATSQVWQLRANRKDADEPWELLRRIADHRHRDLQELYQEARLSPVELAVDPLA